MSAGTSDIALGELATEVAREAGALAAQRRREGVALAATKSTLADIVTEADREVERLIRDRLSAERPDDGFLGEESDATAGISGTTWVVDPIDGTVNYAHGVPTYAVSIAAVTGPPDPEAWTARTGVVFAPALGELFTAVRDEGAWHDGVRLSVTDQTPAGALLATGFGYDPSTHQGDLATVGRVMTMARDLRRGGSAAIDLSYVAAGRYDGFFERGLNPWDFAAGALLVAEAGGRVTRIDVTARRPMLFAGGPRVHARLERLIAGDDL